MYIQHIAVPEAGKDNPRNWSEFLDWFGSEEACLGAAGMAGRRVLPSHLDADLDEFVFRFNARTLSWRGMLFYRLLQQAVATDPVTYESVVRPPPKTT